MGGKFINTTQKHIINSLVEGSNERFKNPYYIFTDKKPTTVTYYNINKTKSTLDESLKIEYSRLGKDSPLRFNKIDNFFIYGLEKIMTSLEMGDFGLGASDIEGDAYILPNTIQPYPNDYFTIDYLKQKLLFKITNVTFDTIENDANFWKVTYKLDRTDDVDILDQIVDNYEMIINNVGTDFKSIIRKSDYDIIDSLEQAIERLKDYYNSLFYNNRVQTYTFTNKGKNFYDPYMIEFLIQHKILNNVGNEYIHIGHQTILPKTFKLDYDKTFFRFLELQDLTFKPRHTSQATYIDQMLSIFSNRAEDYFEIYYIDENSAINYSEYIIENFSYELINNIFENKSFESGDYRNIIVNYFNGNNKINGDTLDILNNIEFDETMELFYNIPVIIYIIESNIKEMLKTYK